MRQVVRNRLVWSVACSVVGLAIAAAPSQALTLGFNDYDLTRYAGLNGGTANQTALDAGLANSRGAGASVHRFMLTWSSVAPTAPASSAEAIDPAWSGYRWEAVDREVKAIVAAGMEPIPCVLTAPRWAEGSGRPAVSSAAPAGTWRVSAVQLQRFSTALGRRYNGAFPDPANPESNLPRVSTFQAWNEPNLVVGITPQWTKTAGKYTVASVSQYRQLLNGVYRGIKAAQPAATVLAAGTAPFGGLEEGDPRIPPVRFYRELLCATAVRGATRIRKGCPTISFDGWAHHTYPIGPPTRHARNAGDVVVPDLGKLTVLMNAAARSGLVKKRAAANLWMTEMSWDSQPDPDGLSLADQALYMQGAFYVLWKAGVNTVVWWNSRDDAKGASWGSSLQSGIFFRGATPADDAKKPSWTAFHFPIAAYRNKGVAALWARAPGAGSVTVQAKDASGTWTTVATLASKGGQVFTGRLRTGPGTQLRAVQGAESSLTWTTF